MCDPLSLLATGATIVGGVVSAGAKYSAGVADELGARITASYMADSAAIQAGSADMIRANVPVLQQQADVLRDSADVARAKARINLARVQDQGDVVGAAQVASFTSRHIDPTSGSPLLLQLQTASRVKGDMDLIAAGAEVERANIRAQAANLDIGAAGEAGRAATAAGQAAVTYGNALSTVMKGQQSRIAGQYGAATSLLSTAASVFKSLGGGGGGGGDGTSFFPSASFLSEGLSFG